MAQSAVGKLQSLSSCSAMGTPMDLKKPWMRSSAPTATTMSSAKKLPTFSAAAACARMRCRDGSSSSFARACAEKLLELMHGVDSE